VIPDGRVAPDGPRIVTLWEAFPTSQALIDRCLTQEQRQRLFLPLTPPRWSGAASPVDGGERSPLSPPLKDAHVTSGCVNQTKAVRLFPSVPCGNRVRLGPGSRNNVCDVSQY
jgi:hypothetical protein